MDAAAFDSLPVEYSCDSFELLDATAVLPRSGGYKTRWRVEQIIVHQTQGGTKPGRYGLLATADYHVRVRGWPGIGYTFYVPFRPESGDGGRPRIYRCHSDEARSYHTGPRGHRELGANATGVAVAFQGTFRSRSHSDGERPSAEQRYVFRPLLKYLFGRYKLTGLDLFAHSDFGKPDCPGDELEDWIDSVRVLAQRDDSFALDDWLAKSRALFALGHLAESDIGPMYTEATRRALHSLEDKYHLPDVGLWTRRVDTVVRRVLRHQTTIKELFNGR
jgi:hypothetical protein